MAAAAPALDSAVNSESQIDVGQISGDVLGGLWAGISSSPWTIALFVLFLGLVLLRGYQAIKYPRHRRDPTRTFGRADKTYILARAGGRCEHHGWLTGRCRSTQQLEADHIVPWSRSGPTRVANGQALCRRHNRAKRDTVPFGWQVRAIERRRQAARLHAAAEAEE